MKSKMSELHVNCQLLVKQITSIKAAASGAEVNIKALSELSDLLVTSCDAFLNVLHECMDLSMPAQAQLAPVKKVTNASWHEGVFSCSMGWTMVLVLN